MTRFMILSALILGSALWHPATASAAEPNNRGCLGKDFSGYARGLNPNLGQVLTHFTLPDGTAVIAGGLGSEVQAHLAGNVPDAVLPNSCND